MASVTPVAVGKPAFTVHTLERLQTNLVHMFKRRGYHEVQWAVSPQKFAQRHNLSVADVWGDFYSAPEEDFLQIGRDSEPPYARSQGELDAEFEQSLSAEALRLQSNQNQNQDDDKNENTKTGGGQQQKEKEKAKVRVRRGRPVGRVAVAAARSMAFMTARERREDPEHSVVVLVNTTGATVGKPDISPYLAFAEEQRIQRLIFVLGKDITPQGKQQLNESNLKGWETFHLEDRALEVEHKPEEPGSLGRATYVPFLSPVPPDSVPDLLKSLYVQDVTKLSHINTLDVQARYLALSVGSVWKKSTVDSATPDYCVVVPPSAAIKGWPSFSYGSGSKNKQVNQKKNNRKRKESSAPSG